MRSKRKFSEHPDVNFNVEHPASFEAALRFGHTLFIKTLAEEINRLEMQEAEKKSVKAAITEETLCTAAENVWKQMSINRRTRQKARQEKNVAKDKM